MRLSKGLFSTGNGEWETPQELFDIINGIFRFDVDVCAKAGNAKCERYFSPEQDGLTQDWIGTVWCNPPYGREIGKWVYRAHNSHIFNGTTVVMLLPSRTDTQWMHSHVFCGAHVIFLKGRLSFGDAGGSAPFPSLLAVYDLSKHRVNELARRLGSSAFFYRK